MGNHVLVIGSGGREHALAWKLAQSSRVGKISVAPGNAGTSQIGESVPIAVHDLEALARFAEDERVDLTVVGPDDPLALGIVDVFRTRRLPVFGPTQSAAQIEASKAFAKQVMVENGIPTAEHRVFSVAAEARRYVRDQGAPIVVKASGLALGKGAYPCRTLDEAERAIEVIMDLRAHGDAGREIVVETFLEGEEYSAHALTDGSEFLLFPAAQDHKRAFDGDHGPNTGGMGSVAPMPRFTRVFNDFVSRRIVAPALAALKRDGDPFVGCLFPGIMLDETGPMVLEYNGRFGDPETQSYVRLLENDLYDLFEACVEGTLGAAHELRWLPGFAVTVVLASGGYPGSYTKGKPITGIREAEQDSRVVVFHAGTAIKDGQLVTNGGRVLGISAVGETIQLAREAAYEAANRIQFEGKQNRTDIGVRAIASGL